ncbi:MAG: hypothetical protein JKY24_07375 [Pseudomonadales bacterium]|nr:hypothetical protein [Pseudomonadales bacterium]
MNDFKVMFSELLVKLKQVAKNNSVIAKPVSVGDRHVIPLCEFKVGLGGGGGMGQGGTLNMRGGSGDAASGNEMSSKKGGRGDGQLQAAGGGVRVSPIATIIINGDDVSVKILGQ